MNIFQHLYPLWYLVIAPDAISLRDVRSGITKTEHISAFSIDRLTLLSNESKLRISGLLKNFYTTRFIASSPVVIVHLKFVIEVDALSALQKRTLVDVVLKSGASVVYVAYGDVDLADQELLDLGLDRRKHKDIYAVLAVATAFLLFFVYLRSWP